MHDIAWGLVAGAVERAERPGLVVALATVAADLHHHAHARLADKDQLAFAQVQCMLSGMFPVPPAAR